MKMSHSKVKIWVHAIFGVKNRNKLIEFKIENKIHNLIKSELIDMKCYVEEINGVEDHVHALFLLSPKKSMTDVMKQAKGAVSYQINQEKMTKQKFSWQVGYGAFSVSESQMHSVKRYIQNQKTHHTKRTFEEEYEEFLKLHKF